MGFGSWLKQRKDKRKSEESLADKLGKIVKLKEQKSKTESKTKTDETKEESEKNVKKIPDKKMDLFQPAAEFIEDDE